MDDRVSLEREVDALVVFLEGMLEVAKKTGDEAIVDRIRTLRANARELKRKLEKCR